MLFHTPPPLPEADPPSSRHAMSNPDKFNSRILARLKIFIGGRYCAQSARINLYIKSRELAQLRMQGYFHNQFISWHHSLRAHQKQTAAEVPVVARHALSVCGRELGKMNLECSNLPAIIIAQQKSEGKTEHNNNITHSMQLACEKNYYSTHSSSA